MNKVWALLAGAVIVTCVIVSVLASLIGPGF